MDIYEMADKIESKEDLIEFLKALLVDLKENHSEWENDTLERYLDGMWGWLQDLDEAFVPEQPSWQFIGNMLLVARIYE